MFSSTSYEVWKPAGVPFLVVDGTGSLLTELVDCSAVVEPGNFTAAVVFPWFTVAEAVMSTFISVLVFAAAPWTREPVFCVSDVAFEVPCAADETLLFCVSDVALEVLWAANGTLLFCVSDVAMEVH